MPCYSPLKGWKSATTGGLTFKKAESANTRMEVACGSCLGCRLDNSRMWAMRIVHEASLHELGHGSCFITLTYDDEHVPEGWSLTPSGASDFQSFMRKLRKSIEVEVEPREYDRNGNIRMYTRPDDKIRYFMVGEYGELCRHSKIGMEVRAADCDFCCVGRPHYHVILFNKTFEDLEVCGRRDELVYYSSKTLEALWGLGFVQIGEVNMKSAAYTARYCLKKITGDKAFEHYQNVSPDGEVHRVQQEYATMSRRPGIGADWFAKYKDDCFPSDEVPVSGMGVIKKVPRYYAGIFEKHDPDTLEEVKAARKKFRDEHLHEYTPARLMAKYKVKKRQVEFLKREL